MRLPRDWLGPREELVPFGRRAASPEPPDLPPSAADFWGERAGSIHDALPAPGDDQIAASPHPPMCVPARRRRRVALAAGLVLTMAASVAVALGLTGPSARETSGPKVNMAAVLSTGVARILERGLAQLDVRAGPGLMAVAHPRTRVGGGATRHRPVFRPQGRSVRSVVTHVYARAPRQANSRITYAASESASVSPPPPAAITQQPTRSPSTSYTGETGTRTTSPASPSISSHASSSSSAAVSPTGESGALGPVQSPNG